MYKAPNMDMDTNIDMDREHRAYMDISMDMGMDTYMDKDTGHRHRHRAWT
jgi:hypothetical protein